MRRGWGADAAAAARLTAATRVADPDPWRNKLRTTLDQPDKASRLTGLQALAKEVKLDELGAVSLQLLGSGLNAGGDSELAVSVLRTAQHRDPGDVWVNYVLARVLQRLSRDDEAIRYYIAARAIRPETAHALAHALSAKGESNEAIEVFRDLARLKPKNGRHLMCLGQELKRRGRSQEAGAVVDKALAALRETIRIKPDDGVAHFHLGVALCDGKHEYAAAEAEIRAAIRIEASTRPQPTIISESHWRVRARSTWPSPNSARRSGSSPTEPGPTPRWGEPWPAKASWTKPSPSTARRSGSSPMISPRTTAWVTPWQPRVSST